MTIIPTVIKQKLTPSDIRRIRSFLASDLKRLRFVRGSDMEQVVIKNIQQDIALLGGMEAVW